MCGCVLVMFLGLRRCTEIKLLDKVSQQMGFSVKMWEHVLQMHVSLATILRVICQKKGGQEILVLLNFGQLYRVKSHKPTF